MLLRTIYVLSFAVLAATSDCPGRPSKFHAIVLKTASDTEEFLTVNEISDLKDYETVVIDNVTMPKLCKDMVKDMPKLKVLDLSGLGIESIEPGAFSNVPNLNVLNLGFNNLTYIDAGVFTYLNVENIHLHNNKINNMHKHAFEHLPNLYLLDLDKNDITEITTRGCKTCPKLHTMILDNNKITTVPENAFGAITSLVHISLRRNKITEIKPKAFYHLDKLTELFLVDNPLTEIKKDAFETARPNLNVYLNPNNINTNELTELKINVFQILF